MFYFVQTAFKRLYKNSGREKGTIRYFREKLNRRNVTIDVKHYEDCEQLFYSVGVCFVIEALLEFFQMEDAKQTPTVNSPHRDCETENLHSHINHILDKFLDEYVFVESEEEDEEAESEDGIWCHGVNVIRTFLVLADMKDAVADGNGEHMSILRKQMLLHFFSNPGFNEYSIEMLINILQCDVLLSEAEAFRCKWAATVNWKGGAGNNIEIDLFQENRNAQMKKLIRSMGANKTEKAITRASKASGGVSKVIESFDGQVGMVKKSSAHSHRSSSDDEKIISKDLRALRPFRKEDGRRYESFSDISCNPIHSFDEDKFREWITKHKNNIIMHYPAFDDLQQSIE